MKLGDSIKAFRKERKLTQAQLAELCGITTTYLSLVENGKKEPTVALMKTIATQLKVPLPVLLFSAITPEDIPEEKKGFFNVIKPSIDSMLNSLMNEDVDSKA